MSTLLKVKRYLGNTHNAEVHDTNNEKVGCQLDEITPTHQRWYDSLSEAKADYAYDNCAHCLGASTR